MNNPYLYILMRNDLDSLVNFPGKMAAHAAHAANQAESRIVLEPDPIVDGWKKWKKSGSWFGTTITLAADITTIRDIVSLTGTHGFFGSIVFDPTYPIKDGAVTHLIPLDTCGFVFGDKDDLFPFLGHLPLL